MSSPDRGGGRSGLTGRTRNLAGRAAASARRRLGGRPPAVTYRDGIPNRADEIIAADPAVRDLMDAGILTMGAYSYFAPTVRVYAGDKSVVRIGSYSSVAPSVQLYVGGEHRTDWVTTYGLRIVFGLPGAYEDGAPASKGDIEIGSDCWVTTESVVTSGVTIGHGAVVATRAVVTRDVRPYAIVAGNPAREVRRRFTDRQVDALLDIAWWDWPVQQVLDAVDSLCDPDIDAFIERFGS